jgi:hypothetical protein
MSVTSQTERPTLPRREQFDPSATITLTVYMRSFNPNADKRRQLSLLEDIEAAERAGVVSELSVETWPQRVRLDETASRADVWDTYEEFRTWAKREGVSLDPPFSVCSMPSCDGERTDSVLTLPEVSLAVYEDGVLSCVYPYQDGHWKRTVSDSIEALSRTGRKTVTAQFLDND